MIILSPPIKVVAHCNWRRVVALALGSLRQMQLDGPRSESSRKPRLEQHAYPVWGLVIKRATYVGVG